MVIWLVGLSGSGKTTIGNEIYKLWKAQSSNTVMVDGDDVRRILQYDIDSKNYTIEERLLNAKRIVEICAWLDRQDINVVCCILCLFDDIMLQNNDIFSRYYQVYIDASLRLLKKRDVKGLYKKAEQGLDLNVVGVGIPFSAPSKSNYVIKMDDNVLSPESLAKSILKSSGAIQ